MTRPINALIAGAQKAGTSSLAAYVGQHPRICTHRRIEIGFFASDVEHDLGWSAAFDRYFGPCPTDSLLLGKSVTVMTDPELLRRVRAHNPDIRIVIVLRNPVDRAYSAFWWARRESYEDLASFEAALDADPIRHGGDVVAIRSTSYIPFGMYADQLEGVFKVFPQDAVSVHLYEDLATDPVSVCGEVFSFLGVDPTFEPDVRIRENANSRSRSWVLARALTAQHPLKRRFREALPSGVADRWRRRIERLNRVPFTPPPMDPTTRARLLRRFAEPNRRLGVLLGRNMSVWDR